MDYCQIKDEIAMDHAPATRLTSPRNDPHCGLFRFVYY